VKNIFEQEAATIPTAAHLETEVTPNALEPVGGNEPAIDIELHQISGEISIDLEFGD
jgi:hypothetical protein